MQDIARVALPSLVSQGDQLARSRGSMAGGELALKAVAAETVRREGVQRAEHLAPAHALGPVDGDGSPGGQGRQGAGHGRGEDDADDLPPEESGRHVDITA